MIHYFEYPQNTCYSILQYLLFVNQMGISNFSSCIFLLLLVCLSNGSFGQLNPHIFFSPFEQTQRGFSQQCAEIKFIAKKVVASEKIFDTTSQNFKINTPVDIVDELLHYSQKFRKLKFSLDDEELLTLAADIRNLCEKDHMALFFISAYFLRSCELLEKQKYSPVQISKIMKKKIQVMMNITSIETYRLKKYGKIHTVPFNNRKWNQIQKYLLPFTPKRFHLNEGPKDIQIQSLILQMVKQAQRNQKIFETMVKHSCKQNGALSFNMNYKIKNNQEPVKMKRVKEKLLRDTFQIYGHKCLNQFLTIGHKRTEQQQRFQDLLSRVYAQIKQIDFVVKDILRAKCMFNSAEQIYSTAVQLMKQIQQKRKNGKQIKLVEFENRFKKTTCDILIIIQIDQMAYQLQLALEYDHINFQISHQMYELSRSKIFSPVVLLFNWFEKIAPEFLGRIGYTLMEQLKQKSENQANQKIMQKQYQMLNQFFNLTSYENIEKLTEKQYYQQLFEEIQKTKEQIVHPFR